MIRRLSKLYRWMRDGLAGTVVASSWALLWLLWPMGRPAKPPEVPGCAAEVSYVRMPAGDTRFRVMPDQFARPPLAGFGIADSIEGMMSEAPEPELPRPDFLERTPEDASRLLDGGRDLLAARIETMPSRYRYVSGAGPVFVSKAAPARGVHADLSHELESAGFQLPSPETMSGKGQKRWMVRAYLDVHPGGWVEHVMLETPCEDSAVNAMLTRYLLQGSVRKAGKSLSGRVTVTFVP